MIWRWIAKPGRCAKANAFPGKPWMRSGRLSGVRLSRRCPLCLMGWSTFPKRAVRSVLCKPNAPPVPKGAASIFILMKLCSPSYKSVNKSHKDGPNSVSGWQLSIPWLMEVSGRDDAPVIADFARISSIYVDAQLSTICMSWLVPSSFLLSFRMRLDFLTDTLAASRPAPQGYRLAGRQQAEAILPTGL
ncbi:hypothetical protein A4R35_00265 [Thermogemmatispora tikiterensis]|uniref:Uncharacterized protein n=1 Tax=Thermogemmatispora tikiterensis TaxID=1825093 RepID=A0A328VF55_9CHLR|nr:hypothetical protein A4R35_00265 [Thermogemmatispora tikiterensis]